MITKLNGLLLLLMVSHFYAHAQIHEVEGYICAAEDKQPLEYATASVIGKGTGTYTDRQGHFRLYINQGDSIHISFVGFGSASLRSDHKPGDTLYLQRESLILKELTVTSKRKSTSKQLGYYVNRPSFFLLGPQKIATYISNPQKAPGQVKELQFKLNGKKKTRKIRNIMSRLCIRIYTLDSDTGLPGADLLTEKLILEVENHQTVLTVDVTRFNVPFPANGLYIGLDLLGYVDTDGSEVLYQFKEKDKHIEIPLSPAAEGSTFEKTFGRPWRKTSFMDVNSIPQNYNACFGLTVEF